MRTEAIHILFQDCADQGTIQKSVHAIRMLGDVDYIRSSEKEGEAHHYFAGVFQNSAESVMRDIRGHEGVQSVSQLFVKLSVTLNVNGMPESHARHVFEQRLARLENVSSVRNVSRTEAGDRDHEITLNVFATQQTAIDRLQGQVLAAIGGKDTRIEYEGLSPL